MEPSNACLLVWTQLRVQLVSSRHRREVGGMAKLGQGLVEPVAGKYLPPLRCFFVRHGAARSIRSGNEAHCVAETEAGIGRRLLGKAELPGQSGQFLAIDFYPSPANKMQ